MTGEQRRVCRDCVCSYPYVTKGHTDQVTNTANAWGPAYARASTQRIAHGTHAFIALSPQVINVSSSFFFLYPLAMLPSSPYLILYLQGQHKF